MATLTRFFFFVSITAGAGASAGGGGTALRCLNKIKCYKLYFAALVKCYCGAKVTQYTFNFNVFGAK